MRFTEVIGRDVVSTSTATKVGRVSSLVVDPTLVGVAALVLKKTPEDADVVLWESVIAVGPDAITVSGSEVFIGRQDERISRLVAKSNRLKKKRVLTETGEQVGTITDVEFDPESGAVTSFTASGEQIDGSRLLGVGSYAVVVRRRQTETSNPVVGPPAG